MKFIIGIYNHSTAIPPIAENYYYKLHVSVFEEPPTFEVTRLLNGEW